MTDQDHRPTPAPLDWTPALEHPDAVAAPVRAALEAWAAHEPRVATEVRVALIDPELADTQALTDAYGLDLAISANCVLVGGRRAGEERVAAAVVRATTRADVNATIKRLLDVRKASFLPTEQAVADSGMEFGGITPLGLPEGYRILLDSLVAEGEALIGSGLRTSKLLLPGDLLASWPRAEVVEGLAR
ncbi:YbaK/EbsC family protein [Litorihabitans aurantiacus]|uniref:YbaK/aminoacyl-tRNA synthetase-associated domain-containing protein n=1 Tax=Litorihabitans aurantiacus TaxID=1930061 RepID=A0AA37UV89_9MICO|nr:YbaK/EbsC family protein [Litorihabitans aurantiacus]GMA31071.1 hypothetical protein GCM10025875_10630 [Litorihabitans aurantiacus]